MDLNELDKEKLIETLMKFDNKCAELQIQVIQNNEKIKNLEEELKRKVDLDDFKVLQAEVIELKIENKKHFEEIIKIQKEARKEQRELLEKSQKEQKELYQQTIDNQNKEKQQQNTLFYKIVWISVGSLTVLGLRELSVNLEPILRYLGFN